MPKTTERRNAMNIQKWNPWNWFKNENEGKAASVPVHRERGSVGDPLWNMHREIDRLFDGVFSPFTGSLPRLLEGGGYGGLSGMLKPNLDIKETKRDYQISVEVPCVDENDIKLELVGGALTIKGEKKHEKKHEDENYYCVERSYGSFSRTLNLPSDANEDSIEAKFKSGVLTITVPRRQIAKTKDEPKVIAVKSAA